MSGAEAADEARASKLDGRRPFAVWLLPDQASSRRWQTTIDRLAASRVHPGDCVSHILGSFSLIGFCLLGNGLRRLGR